MLLPINARAAAGKAGNHTVTGTPDRQFTPSSTAY